MGDMTGNHVMPPQPPQQQQAPAPSMPQMSQFSPQMVQPVENFVQPQPSQSPIVNDAMPQPSSAPNMFKMQKGRSELRKESRKRRANNKISILRPEEIIRGHFGQLGPDSAAAEGACASNGHAILQPRATTTAGILMFA